MKYKIILLFFLTSCISHSNNSKNSFIYSAKGFAYVNDQLFVNLDDIDFFVSHHKLKLGTKIRISNPINDKFLETTTVKKIKYDNFYKVLISSSVVEKLELDSNFPYIEINEIKKNKSFVAEKAITEIIEKRIANKAPVSKINIANLSVEKPNIKRKKKKIYSILVAEFYNLESAELLKKRFETILTNSNYQLIYINKKKNQSYELLMGPYNTINKLKNDYTILNNSNFEDLDIKIND
jgi:hypothetical protein